MSSGSADERAIAMPWPTPVSCPALRDLRTLTKMTNVLDRDPEHPSARCSASRTASGSALTAVGLVKRATKDVDLLAILADGELHSAEPLPDSLRVARDRVARDFDLDDKWLNSGPTSILMWGL